MKFLFSITWICAFVAHVAKAQVVIPVQIQTAGEAKPVSYAEILISKSKSFQPGSILSFISTDENGKGSIAVNPGRYFIKVSAVSFEDHIDSFSTESNSGLQFRLQPKQFDLDHVVVTVQYKKQSAEKAVERVLVVDEKDLKSRSVVNLGEALQQQLNIQIRQDNSTGTSMSLMGITGQNVKILVDGVPVVGRLDGNIDLSQINMNDVERIEVIEGPMSTTYGSNAIAGVINIITKKSVSGKEQLSADVYHQSSGQDNFGFSAGKQFGKTALRMNFGRNFFAGWSPQDYGRYDLWKPKEQYFGRFQLSRKIGKVNLNFKSEAFRELLLNKGQLEKPYFETAFDEKYYTWRIDQKLNADWKIGKYSNFNGFVAYNYYNRQRLKTFRDMITLGSVPISSGSDTTEIHAFMSRATFSRSPLNTHWSYQLGYDINIESTAGQRIESGKQSIGDYALFGSAEWNPTSYLSIKPGFRKAYNTAFSAPLVPMISGRLIKGNYTYRLSYSQGFRAPDVKELYIEFIDINHDVIGNKNLSPERSQHLLFSIDGKRMYKKVLLKPSLSTFYNDIHDKITLAAINNIEYTYVNLSTFKSLGGDLKFTALTKFWLASLGYNYTSIATDANPGRYQHFQQVNGNIRFTLKVCDINLYTIYNGKQNFFTVDEEGQVHQSYSQPYTMMDFQIGRKFIKNKLSINAGLKNLLNVTQINNVSTGGAHSSSGNISTPVGTGRTYFVKAGITL